LHTHDLEGSHHAPIFLKMDPEKLFFRVSIIALAVAEQVSVRIKAMSDIRCMVFILS
jgi:hypothetical protein